MGLMEYLLIAVGAIAVAFLMITIVRRISAYYRQRYNMSVWAGVFMLAISAILIAFMVFHYHAVNVAFLIIAIVLLLLTGFLDIRHAGVGMGLLALLFQIILSSMFLAILVVSIIILIIRALRRGDDFILDTVTGTSSGFRNGVRLFFMFFIP